MPRLETMPPAAPPTRGHRVFTGIACAWILMVTAGLLALAVWALDRGLDMQDGAFYVFCALQPEGVQVSTTGQHWFTAPLFRLGGGLVGFRALGLGILVGCASLLGLGALKAFRAGGVTIESRLASAVVVASTVMGALLLGVMFRFDPSYNLLAAASVYGGVGLALLGTDGGSPRRAAALAVGAGAMLGVTFLCKFSAGVLGLGAALVAVALWNRTLPVRAAGAGLMVAGMAAVVLGVPAVQMPLSAALAEFRAGAEVFGLATNGESVTERLARYGREARHLLYLLRTAYWVPLLGMGLFAVTRRWWFAAISLPWFAWAVIAQGAWIGGTSHYPVQVVPLLAALLLVLLARGRDWNGTWKTGTWGALLLGLPFGVAIGTSININAHIIMSLAPWGALVGVVAVSRGRDGRPSPAALVAAAMFVTLVAAQVIAGNHRAPYALARSLAEQTVPVKVDRLGSFRVDPETHRLMQELAAVAEACDIAPGRPLIGLYSGPGVAMLLKAKPPVTPWLFNAASAQAVLALAPPAEVRDAVVAVTVGEGDRLPPMPARFATFPAGYRLCGTVTLPYRQIPFDYKQVQLWVPESPSARRGRPQRKTPGPTGPGASNHNRVSKT